MNPQYWVATSLMTPDSVVEKLTAAAKTMMNDGTHAKIVGSVLNL